MEYTSSDESTYEEDSDREEAQLTAYRVKHLPWERTKLTNAKTILDEIYRKSLSARVRRSLVPRISHSVDSKRDIPRNVVGWAVRRPALTPRGGLISSASASASNDSSSFSEGPISSSTPRVVRQKPDN